MPVTGRKPMRVARSPSTDVLLIPTRHTDAVLPRPSSRLATKACDRNTCGATIPFLHRWPSATPLPGSPSSAPHRAHSSPTGSLAAESAHTPRRTEWHGSQCTN